MLTLNIRNTIIYLFLLFFYNLQNIRNNILYVIVYNIVRNMKLMFEKTNYNLNDYDRNRFLFKCKQQSISLRVLVMHVKIFSFFLQVNWRLCFINHRHYSLRDSIVTEEMVITSIVKNINKCNSDLNYLIRLNKLLGAFLLLMIRVRQTRGD